MILGYPFLREFNPQIDWAKGELQHDAVMLQSAWYKYLKGFFQRAEKTMARTGEMPDTLKAFLRRTNLAQEWNRIEEMHKTHLTMETIPPEFKRHWKVFSEELSKRYPSARNPDMAIKFLPDAPTSIKCRPYPRSKDEARVEDKWVKEQVALGRLQKGPSPIVSPVFHITRRTVTKSVLSWTTDGSMQLQCETTIPSLAYGKPWRHHTATASSRSLTYDGATATFAYRKRTNTRQPYRHKQAPTSPQ